MSWSRAGYLRSGMEGPAWDLHPPVCLPGRGDCRVTLHAVPPAPVPLAPTSGEGPREGGPGRASHPARQCPLPW